MLAARMPSSSPRAVERGLLLTAVARRVRIWCADDGLRATLRDLYASMRTGRDHPDLECTVDATGTGFAVSDPTGESRTTADLATLLPLLDESLTIGFQRLRPDLLFLHAAALETGGRACLLVAPSGGGKSTTTWALTHHGFRYLSDELAPVDLARLTVHPYPRALGLKGPPPAPYGLPAGTLVTGPNAWVPAARIAFGDPAATVPLAALFFLNRRAGRAVRLRPLSVSEASVRLYANTLNALAHPADGLDAVVELARRLPSFELPTGHLPTAHRRVREALTTLG